MGHIGIRLLSSGSDRMNSCVPQKSYVILSLQSGKVLTDWLTDSQASDETSNWLIRRSFIFYIFAQKTECHTFVTESKV